MPDSPVESKTPFALCPVASIIPVANSPDDNAPSNDAPVAPSAPLALWLVGSNAPNANKPGSATPTNAALPENDPYKGLDPPYKPNRVIAAIIR